MIDFIPNGTEFISIERNFSYFFQLWITRFEFDEILLNVLFFAFPEYDVL